jgi:thiol-disulfide isomerase/thioredoxin
MKIFPLLAIVLVLAAPATPVGIGQTGEVPIAAADELKAMIPINLQDFEGKKVSSDKFRGKILVVDFWATWCVPCIAEVPKYNKLQQKYADQGVEVIGVALASGDAKDIKPFVSKHQMKYTVLIGDDDQVYDLNVVAFPTTYVLTRDMKVLRRYIGTSPGKAAAIDADIQKLLTTN